MKAFLVILYFCPLLIFSQDTSYINKLNREAFEIRSASPQKSISLATHALLLSQKINYKDGEALAYNRIGLSKTELGEYDSSLYYFKKNLFIRDFQHNVEGQASTLQNMGITYKLKGIPDSAIFCYTKAANIWDSIGNNKKYIENELNIGVMFRLENRYQNALEYFSIVLKNATDFNDTLMYANVLLNIGNTYDQMNDTSHSHSYYKMSINYYETQHNKLGVGKCFHSLGISYFSNGNFSLATDYCFKALHIFISIQNMPGINNVKNTLGNIYLKLGKYDLAIKYLEESKDAFDKMADNDDRLELYYNLSKAYGMQNQFDSGYLYLEKYTLLYDSLQTKERNLTYQEQLVKFDTKKKELENNNLIKDNRNIALKNRIYFISALFLIFLFIVFIIIYIQQRKLQNKKLQIEKHQVQDLLQDQELKTIHAMLEGQDRERKRIAEDLHDRIGSLLSTIKLYFNAIEDDIILTNLHTRNQYKIATELLDKTVHEVRQVSHNLVSGVLMKLGLIAALEDLCNTAGGTGLITCGLHITGLDERIDLQTEITVYRILQELLSNTLKHSKATIINMQLVKMNNVLEIVVTDNGKGFEKSELGDGMGLNNVKTRIQKLNGEIQIESLKNSGTEIVFRIPLQISHHDTFINS